MQTLGALETIDAKRRRPKVSKCMKCRTRDATCEVLYAHASQEPQVAGKYCNPCSKAEVQEIKIDSRAQVFVYTRALP